MKDELLISGGLLSLVLLLGLCVWVGGSYFESKTYNKLTGAHTTTWDAMWVELRVQDSPKNK